MSKLSFHKYQGAGNDFIIIDDRAQTFDLSLVPRLCHRHTGVGADGVILLQNANAPCFRMRYFNANGQEVERCGNGLRCFVKYLKDQGLAYNKIVVGKDLVTGFFVQDRVAIEMGAVPEIKKVAIHDREVFLLNTGVPHAVLFGGGFEQASEIRNHVLFWPEGVNVNFVDLATLKVRTYERGVEGETLACGTGACAVAVVAHQVHGVPSPMFLHFAGGVMEVQIVQGRMLMIGPATFVFEGACE